MTRLTLTEGEAAAQLGLSPRTLADLRRAGKIRYVLLSARKVAYIPQDLVDYRDAQARFAEQPPTPASPPRRRSTASGVIVPFTQRRESR